MRYIAALLLFLIPGGFAHADYRPTSIYWKGWEVASSENLYAGSIHQGYPLTNLFDGDPRTAWVFSGTGKCKDAASLWRSTRALRVRADKPFWADQIRLMNGYNKFRATFLRNNRVVTVRLTVNERIVKTARLSDAMGWHPISLPRVAISSLRIEFTGVRRGRDNDLCLSELALYRGERRVAMDMPGAVLYTRGSECGCGANAALLTRAGVPLAKDEIGEGGGGAWSPDGVYVASAELAPAGFRLWVADTGSGRVYRVRTWRRKNAGRVENSRDAGTASGKVYTPPVPEVWGVQWKDDRRIEVTLNDRKKTYTDIVPFRPRERSRKS